jgi:hypothetical protein
VKRAGLRGAGDHACGIPSTCDPGGRGEPTGARAQVLAVAERVEHEVVVPVSEPPY